MAASTVFRQLPDSTQTHRSWRESQFKRARENYPQTNTVNKVRRGEIFAPCSLIVIFHPSMVVERLRTLPYLSCVTGRLTPCGYNLRVPFTLPPNCSRINGRGPTMPKVMFPRRRSLVAYVVSDFCSLRSGHFRGRGFAYPVSTW